MVALIALGFFTRGSMETGLGVLIFALIAWLVSVQLERRAVAWPPAGGEMGIGAGLEKPQIEPSANVGEARKAPGPEATAIELRNLPDPEATSPSPPQKEERVGERRPVEIAKKTPLPNPLPAAHGEGEDQSLSAASLNSMAVGPEAEKTAGELQRLRDLLDREAAERKRLESELADAELRFRSVTHFAHDGVVSSDPQGLVQGWNEGAEKLFGYTESEVRGKSLTELVARPEREHYWEEILCFLETGSSTVSGKWVELLGVTKEGKQFPMEVFLQSGSAAEGAYLTLIIHDLTRRREVEETLRRETARVELMQRVAAAANEAGSIEEALQSSIDLVCNYADWAVGHVYLLDAQGQLAPTNIWHLKSREWFEEFRENTIQSGPATPEHLAGRVAKANRSIWIKDLLDRTFPRSAAAEEVGLQSAFAFPVKVSQELRAVCEFFSTRLREPDDSLFELADYIAGQVSRVIERKWAEAALQDSEERNRTLLANLPQHVFFKNSDLRFETVNALFAEALGKKPEEVIGKTDYDLFPKELAEKYRTDDLRVMKNRLLETLVEKHLAQGQERFVEVIKSPVIDSQGKVLGVLGLFTDITERKKAEEFRNRLAAIVESSRDAIFSRTLEGKIASWNVGAEAIYGYSAEEVLGRSMDLLIPNEMAESETRFQARVREGDQVKNVDTIHLRKDGQRIYVSLTVSPIFGADGAVSGASVVARDVTEMKRAEAEIERTRTLLQSVVETLPLMVFMKTADDLRFVLVNKAGKEVMGFKDEEIIGKTDHDLFPAEQAEILVQQDRITLESGQLVESVETINTNYKGLRVLHTRKTSIRDTAGKPQYILGISEDITERKVAEEKLRMYALRLEQSNRALQDFASVASHDLQEPLRKVQAFGDRLKTKFAHLLTEEGCDYLQRMQNAAQRMQKLIEDLLAFSRVTSNAQPFVRVDLSEVARDVLTDLEVRIEQKKAKVELGELPVLEADPTQMRQLLQNLTVNALKFQRPGSTPRVKIYSQPVSSEPRGQAPQLPGGERYQIVVEDNGIGFDEKYLEKIFTVFQRLHSRQEYEGTGVGLAICQKITERHQGKITATSQLGQGTKFVVTLPAKQTENSPV